MSEGYIDVPGGKVWYRAVGGGSGTPLLCLHGGPGATHNVLESLEALADRRRVIFYDQLGCGKSERPSDPALWTVDRFVAELAQVRKALKLRRPHLFGSSWGGILAMQYVLDRKADLQSLVEIGVDKNTTVVFPAPLMTTIAELGSFLAGEKAAAVRGGPAERR